MLHIWKGKVAALCVALSIWSSCYERLMCKYVEECLWGMKCVILALVCAVKRNRWCILYLDQYIKWPFMCWIKLLILSVEKYVFCKPCILFQYVLNNIFWIALHDHALVVVHAEWKFRWTSGREKLILGMNTFRRKLEYNIHKRRWQKLALGYLAVPPVRKISGLLEPNLV
jgi:hypothetical protein